MRLSRGSRCFTRWTTTRSLGALRECVEVVTSIGNVSVSISPSSEAEVKCDITPRPLSHIHVARTNCRQDSLVAEVLYTPGRTGLGGLRQPFGAGRPHRAPHA